MVQPRSPVPGEDKPNKKLNPADPAGAQDLDTLGNDIADPGLRAFLQNFSGPARAVLMNAMYSGSLESVQRTSSAMNLDTGMGGSAGRTEDKNDSFYRWLLNEINRQLAELNEELARIDKRIAAAEQEIKDNTVRIDQNTAMLNSIRQDLANLDRGILPERNADGTFKDPAKEKMIAEYEKTYGKIDRNDPEALRRAMLWAQYDLQEQITRDNERNEELRRQIEEDRRRRQQLETQVHAKIQAKQELDKAGYGTLVAYGTADKKVAEQAVQQELQNYDVISVASSQNMFGDLDQTNPAAISAPAQNNGNLFADLEQAALPTIPSSENAGNISYAKSTAADVAPEGGIQVASLRGSFTSVRGQEYKPESLEVEDNKLKTTAAPIAHA